jgi:hypothetical protein
MATWKKYCAVIGKVVMNDDPTIDGFCRVAINGDMESIVRSVERSLGFVGSPLMATWKNIGAIVGL